MKTKIANMILVAFISLGALSCKEKGTEAATSEAKEAAKSIETATSFRIDTEASVIHWKGSKPGKDHVGTLTLNSGYLASSDKNISAGDFVIDMNSITNTDLEGQSKDNLEAHLKGTVEGKEQDFFNVIQYPTAGFVITSVSGENGDITLSGNLTIKDKTHNIEFPAVVSFPGDGVFLKSKPFTIDRTLWGVNFMSKSIFEELKDQFISDDIELTVELHGKKG